MKTLYKITLTLVFVLINSNFAHSQTEREKGIKLYNEGKNKEAVAVLEKATKQLKTDAEAWNALGLAYTKQSDEKKAIKAFEKAVSFNPQSSVYYTNLAYAYFLNNKLNKAQTASTKAIGIDPKNANAFYLRGAANVWEGDNESAITDADRAIAVDSDYSLAYNLKSDALLAKFGRRVSGGSKPIDEVNLLQQAKEVLETCLKNCQNNPNVKIQEERLDTLTVFHKYFSKNRDAELNAVSPGMTVPVAAALPDPSVTPLKILSKPPPSYTDKARQDNVVGEVRLVVLFSETGRVTHTLVLKGLGGGLTANAVKAARSIKFEPAMKDGKPFSQVKIVFYTFSIY
jgi:TonB family protein